MAETLLDHKSVQFEFAKKGFFSFIEGKDYLLPYLKPEKTPLLLMDLEGIKGRYIELKYHFPNFNVYYAVKANDHERIIRALAELGAGFEVASTEELNKVLSVGVSPNR